jgi:hypothetical protein
MISDLSEDTNLPTAENDEPTIKSLEFKEVMTSLVPAPVVSEQFTTRTGNVYYKIGDIVSITRSTIPNLMENSPQMNRVRRYRADVEFSLCSCQLYLGNFRT